MNIPTTTPQYGKFGQQPGIPTNNGPQASIANVQWRSTLTRDQRQDLISKIYNELIRATGEAPGPNVWMKASNYELKLFHESQDRGAYLTKISRRLYLLSQRATMMNPLMQQVQQMQQQQQNNMGMPMTSMGMNPVMGQQVPNYGNSTFRPSSNGVLTNGRPGGIQQPGVNNMASPGQMNPGQPPNQMMPGGPPQGNDLTQQFWAKHAELKSKYWEDCILVYKAFRKYVDSGRPEDEQNKKLKNLLHYVHQVVTFLSEDFTKNPPKPLAEVEKAEAYIKKIVLPYLNKLKSEKNKKSMAQGNPAQMGQQNVSMGFGFPNQQQPQANFNTGNSFSYSNTATPNMQTATSSGMMDFSLNNFSAGGDNMNQFQASMGLSMPGDLTLPGNTNSGPNQGSAQGSNSGGSQSQQLMTLVETL